MKIKSLVITVGCAAFLASLPAQAGEAIMPMDTGPVDTAGVSNLLDPIETTLSTGFDSSYMFRGYNLGEEALWTAIDFAVPVTLPLVGDATLSAGAWYINPTEPSQGSPPFSPASIDDELDLYMSVGTTMGPLDVAFGYTHYHYPEGLAFGDSNEIGLNVGTSVGIFDLGLGYYYNFDKGDVPPPGVNDTFEHYWEASVGTGWDLTDRIGLSVGITAGAYSGDFSHLQFSASLPIQIAENVVLEPYIAYLDNRNSGVPTEIPEGGIPGTPIAENDNDDFFGGISLSVSF